MYKNIVVSTLWRRAVQNPILYFEHNVLSMLVAVPLLVKIVSQAVKPSIPIVKQCFNFFSGCLPSCKHDEWGFAPLLLSQPLTLIDYLFVREPFKVNFCKPPFKNEKKASTHVGLMSRIYYWLKPLCFFNTYQHINKY